MAAMRLVALTFICLVLTACSSTPDYRQEVDAAAALQICNQLMEKGNYDDATHCYETLRARSGGSELSAEAELQLADISFEKSEYLLAAESYRAFAKLHPAHSKLAYVYYKAGLSYLRESPKAIDRDQQYLDEALGYLEVGLRYFPNSPYQEVTQSAHNEVKRRLAARELYVGKFYYKREEYQSALRRFATVADKYPKLGHDEEALFLLAKSYLALEAKQKAFEVTAHLKKRYPNSRYLNKLIKDLDLE